MVEANKTALRDMTYTETWLHLHDPNAAFVSGNCTALMNEGVGTSEDLILEGSLASVRDIMAVLIFL